MSEFLNAALPWLALGMVIAVVMTMANAKKK